MSVILPVNRLSHWGGAGSPSDPREMEGPKGHIPPSLGDTRVSGLSPQTSDPCPSGKGMGGKQAGFVAHRELPSGRDLPEREAGHEAAPGGSWGQASVVSAPSAAACSPCECQAEPGAREAGGWDPEPGVWGSPGSSKRLGPQGNSEVLSRAGILRCRLGQDSCDVQPPLNYVTLGRSRSLSEPQFPLRITGTAARSPWQGKAQCSNAQGRSGPGLPSALAPLGLRSPLGEGRDWILPTGSS